MKKTSLFLLLATVFLSSLTLQGQTRQKIGFVNSNKIFQELPAAQEVQRRIDTYTKPLQDSLEAMQRGLQQLYEDYQRKEALMNEATKRAEQQRLLELERRFNEFRVQKFGAEGDVAKETERLLEPIRDDIRMAISTVAKDEKYTFVFDKTEQIQILLYGDPAHDLTFKVIDKLKRGR
ncbi:MAG: OmpH family outer membrane protein [Bacteroidota bacterium]